MMKNALPVFALVFASLLSISACSQKVETSVSNEATSASSAPASAAPQQTLSSQDGKVSLTVSGQFTDKLADAKSLLSNVPADKLILLQQDASQDLMYYAADFGAAKGTAEAYFKQLAAAIKADTELSNTTVAEPKDGRLAYHFSHGTADNSVNEACVALHGDHIRSVCAVSTSTDAATLAASLNQISVK